MHNLIDKSLSKNLVKILRSYETFYKKSCQDKAGFWLQIHASSYCDGHARSHVNIVVRSWKFLSFKNLAIETCKILAKIRQDLGSKYTRYLIVIIMQDHNGKNFKILKAFLLGLQDISENAPSIRHGRHSILYYSNGKGLYNVC